jgi:hypothetical protein
MYSFMIDTIHTRIWDGPHSDNYVPDNCDVDSSMMTRDEIFQSTGQATFGCVHRDKLGKEYQYKVDWDTRTHTDLLTLPIALMEFLFDSFKGTKLHFVPNTNKTSILFDAIHVFSQMVPFMTG